MPDAVGSHDHAPQATGGPVTVDTVVAGGWLLTMTRSGRCTAPARWPSTAGSSSRWASGRTCCPRYTPQLRIDAPDGVITPGLVNGHRHLLCCAKGAMPEGGQTLDALRRFIYPSFAALTEQDMYVHARARRRGDDPVRHHPVRGAGLQPPGTPCWRRWPPPGSGPAPALWTWDQAGPPPPPTCPTGCGWTPGPRCAGSPTELTKVRKFGHPRDQGRGDDRGRGHLLRLSPPGRRQRPGPATSLFVVHKFDEPARGSELEAERVRVPAGRARHADPGALDERHLAQPHDQPGRPGRAVRSGTQAPGSHRTRSSALKLAKGTTQTGKWPELLAAGVPMALGTDAENVSNHTDICRSMQLAALLPRDARRDPGAVTAEQAVEMATISGATALWMDDVTGSLEPGKQVDLVVFDTADFDWRPLHNPVANLVYGVTGHSVDTVLVGGDVLLDHKTLTRVDEAELREQVEQINRRVLRESASTPRPSGRSAESPPDTWAARGRGQRARLVDYP